LTAAVRREVQALDANLPVYNVRTLADQRAGSLYVARFAATLSGFFGGLALLLASVGIYGVMAAAAHAKSAYAWRSAQAVWTSCGWCSVKACY
jgi:hypothetical protein